MADASNGTSISGNGLQVFLSYSRKDSSFTRRIADALVERGYAADFDQASYDPDNVASGISAEDEWWQRLQQMIASADTMVFIVSPNSAASKVCDEEIAYARALGKRIIPILCRSIDFAKAPPRLSALNVKINFVDDCEDAFSKSLDQLCAALDLDVNWHREARRLVALAVRWDTMRRPDELLLNAADVEAIDTLFQRRPREAPEPSSILLDLLHNSRAKLVDEDRKKRRIVGRAFVRPAEAAFR